MPGAHSRYSLRHLLQQPHDLLLRLLQLRVDLFQRPRRRVLVEVAVEVDLVAYFVLATVHPGVGYMGPYLALEVGDDVVLERHVLEVAQVGVGLVALVAAAPGYWLSLGVLLSKDA